MRCPDDAGSLAAETTPAVPWLELGLALLRHSRIYGKSPEPVMSSISDARAEAGPRPGMDAVRAGSMNGPEAQILSLWLPQGVRSSLPRFRLG